MIVAIADARATLKLSVWYEDTKELLQVAARDRDMVAFRRAAIRMDSERVNELPIETQRELDNLYALAVSQTGAGQP
jgi:hypothetical protein